MKYPKSEMYNKEFLKENMMGPNCIKILEEMTWHFKPEAGTSVLDLGCGRGLTSIFLAKEFGVTVYATDLWIPATDNYTRFKEAGLGEKIIPIHSNALDLPYADGFFDAAVSVDAYHYFGADEGYMDRCLAPLIKKGGVIAIAVPGIKEDYKTVPREMAQYISQEDFNTFHSCEWWKKLLGASKLFTINIIDEIDGFDETWSDWLECDNPYAVSDRGMLEANTGHYMNLIYIIGNRI